MNDENRYLNNEELEAFIAEVERKAMIAPPVYLKAQILDEVRKEAEKHDEGGARERREKKARVQFLVYSVKIIAAAAAAVLCLTVVPMDNTRSMALSSDAFLEKRISKDVEKYREEQKKIEEEMINEIRDGKGADKNGNEIVEKTRIGQSEPVWKIIDRISSLFGTEE